jgi:hypothetical protein
MSSTCLEPQGSSSGRRLYIQLWHGTFYMHQYKQSSAYKSVFDAIEHTLIRTRLLDSIEHTHLPTRLLILKHVKRTIP